ncbi:MAG: class I SAM-dependent methyltransferase [Hyphococcus sp.]
MSDALRYARFDAFRRLMGPFAKQTRGARMRQLEEAMALSPGMRVLDLGGQPDIWNFVSTPLEITILNLPGVAAPAPAQSVHSFDYVEGDACKVEAYGDRSFELVFSNSVIEHVGDEAKQAAFASEVRRLAGKYWVQTPSIWFPIEAHTGMPFWFLMPAFMRARFIRNWESKLPAWTQMVKETTVLSRGQMQRFFPDARLMTERKYGFPKSYIACKT